MSSPRLFRRFRFAFFGGEAGGSGMCSLRHVVSSGGTSNCEMFGVSVGGVTGVFGGLRQSYSRSSGGSSAVMGRESSYCWNLSSNDVGKGLSGDRAFATLPLFVSQVVP